MKTLNADKITARGSCPLPPIDPESRMGPAQPVMVKLIKDESGRVIGMQPFNSDKAKNTDKVVIKDTRPLLSEPPMPQHSATPAVSFNVGESLGGKAVGVVSSKPIPKLMKKPTIEDFSMEEFLDKLSSAGCLELDLLEFKEKEFRRAVNKARARYIKESGDTRKSRSEVINRFLDQEGRKMVTLRYCIKGVLLQSKRVLSKKYGIISVRDPSGNSVEDELMLD